MCPAMLLTRSVGCQGIWIGALSADPAEWGRSRCQTLAATSVKVLSPAARLVESQRCKTHGSDVVDDRPGSCWTAHVTGTAKPTPNRRRAPAAALLRLGVGFAVPVTCAVQQLPGRSSTTSDPCVLHRCDSTSLAAGLKTFTEVDASV